MSKKHYTTKQMKELEEFLKENKGKHVTASEINEYFKKMDITYGLATIYRNLDKLVESGVVTKYVIDGTSSACFEYVGEDKQHSENCYHCKCSKCGKIIHLHCEEVEKLNEHIMVDHGFMIDPNKTVFYGLCTDCQGKVS